MLEQCFEETGKKNRQGLGTGAPVSRAREEHQGRLSEEALIVLERVGKSPQPPKVSSLGHGANSLEEKVEPKCSPKVFR